MFGYSLNYLIDMENAVIPDIEETPTRISKEVDATETMIDRTEDRFGLKPDRIADDVAYGTGETLGWLVGRGINPHIPVWDQSEVAADRRFVRDNFNASAPECQADGRAFSRPMPEFQPRPHAGPRGPI